MPFPFEAVTVPPLAVFTLIVPALVVEATMPFVPPLTAPPSPAAPPMSILPPALLATKMPAVSLDMATPEAVLIVIAPVVDVALIASLEVFEAVAVTLLVRSIKVAPDLALETMPLFVAVTAPMP